MTARALFSITDEVLNRFRDLVPFRERSQEVERLMREEIARRELAREQHIERLALQVESRADFADVRAASDDVNAVAGEALE